MIREEAPASLERSGVDPSHGDRPLRLWPWILTLGTLILLPGLYLEWLIRVHAFRWDKFVDTTAIVLGFTIVVFLLVRTRVVDVRVALAITGVLVPILFLWPLFTAIGALVTELAGTRLAGDAFVVLLAAAALGLAVRIGDDPGFIAVLAVAATTFAVVMAVGMADRVEAVGPSSVGGAVEARGLPDVVIVVLDEYGRSDVMGDLYGVDTEGFHDELERRSFMVSADALSSYNHTYASVAGMLELDYVVGDGPMGDSVWERTRRILSGENRLFQLFHQHGYHITSFENAWGGSNCTAAVDRCVRDGITAASAWRLGVSSILRPFVLRFLPHPFPYQARDQLEVLGDVAVTGPDDRPTLTFAHVLTPHTPYQLGPHCEIRAGTANARLSDLSGEELAVKQELYADQVACVDSLLLAAVDRIIGAHPGTVIVLTGDHGPEPFPIDYGRPAAEQSGALRARFGVFLAIRSPAECGGDVASPINALRLATDCALGTGLGPLPERWFLTPPESVDGVVIELATPTGPP